MVQVKPQFVVAVVERRAGVGCWCLPVVGNRCYWVEAGRQHAAGPELGLWVGVELEPEIGRARRAEVG